MSKFKTEYRVYEIYDPMRARSFIIQQRGPRTLWLWWRVKFDSVQVEFCSRESAQAYIDYWEDKA